MLINQRVWSPSPRSFLVPLASIVSLITSKLANPPSFVQYYDYNTNIFQVIFDSQYELTPNLKYFPQTGVLIMGSDTCEITVSIPHASSASESFNLGCDQNLFLANKIDLVEPEIIDFGLNESMI